MSSKKRARRKRRSPSGVVIDDASLMDMTGTILREINQPSGVARQKITKEKLARYTGLEFSRINSIINVDSQNTGSISLDEVRAVLEYAAKYAAETADISLANSILDRCRALKRAIQKYLGVDGWALV